MKYDPVPLVGGYYADDTRSWSSQDCVNWLPTQAEKAGTRTPSMLKTPPGLREFVINPAAPLSLTGDLGDGIVGGVVSYQYIVSGGVAPYVVSIVSGALPSGLTMNGSGLVTGTRTTSQTSSWVIGVTDAFGNQITLPDSCNTIAVTTLDPTTLGSDGGTGGVVAADKLTLTKNTDGGGFSVGARVYSSAQKTTGKYYFEATVLVAATMSSRGMCVGLENSTNFGINQVIHVGTSTLELACDGTFYQNGNYTGGSPSFNANGTTVGIAVDLSTGKWWWRNAAGWNAGGDPATGTSPMGTLTALAMTGGVVPYVIAYSSNGSIRANLGNAPFVLGAVPAGFTPGWTQ